MPQVDPPGIALVHVQALFVATIGAPAHLPQPGHAGFEVEVCLCVQAITAQLICGDRAGSNKAHVTT